MQTLETEMTQVDHKWIHWSVRAGPLTIITYVTSLARSISCNQLRLVADH